MVKEDKELPKTGTTTVGIVCKDGIVLAADRRATAGFIVSKNEKKIAPITDEIAVTTAGSVSEIQLLVKLIKAELRLKDLHTSRKPDVKEAANLLAGLLYSSIRKMTMVPSIAAFILGGIDEKGFHLFQLFPDGAIITVDDYISDGSGCVFALGVFETIYKKGLSVDEGVKLAVKGINAALQRDMNSGNGIDVVTITDKGIRTVLEKEINLRLEA